MQSPPSFPQRSLTSQGVLYRPLQDIEVYVEDEGSEVFYTELLTRLVRPDIRIHKVIPLRGRTKVIRECEAYKGEGPVLFIIDGDLSWVAGQEIPSHPKMFVNPCYCVENYLVCEHAMVEVAYENNGKVTKEEIKKELSWFKVVGETKDSLMSLFCEFAVAHLLAPMLKTTSYGFSSVCTQKRKKDPPVYDRAKAEALRLSVREKILAVTKPVLYGPALEAVHSRVAALSDPLDAVSGKHFLLPLVMFSIRRIAPGNIGTDSLLLRLARHCLLEKLNPLGMAIRAAVAQGVRDI